MAAVILSAVGLIVAGATGLRRDACAAGPLMRIGLASASGTGGKDVLQTVGVALGAQGFTVIRGDELLGAGFDLEVSIDAPPGLRAIAGQLQLRAFVATRTVTRGRQLVTTVVVYDGASGRSAGRTTISSAGGKERHLQAVEAGFWRQLGQVIQETKGAPVRIHVSRSAQSDPSRAQSPASWPAVGKLEVLLGPRLLSRSLRFQGQLADAPADFSTRGTPPAVALEGAWRPLGHVGVSVGLEQGRTLSSTLSADAQYASPNFDYHGALLLCIRHPRGLLDFSFGGGFQRFGFVPASSAQHLPVPVPEVWYEYLRAGLAGRIDVAGPLVLLAGAYYRNVLTPGPISRRDWFPSLSVRGFEAMLGAGYRLYESWEVRLQLDVRHYSFTFGRTPGEPHTADAAIDLYWGGLLGIAYVLGP